MLPGSAGQTEHLRGDADPALIEGLDSNLVAFAYLAQYGGGRHTAVLEDQLAGGRSPDAELVFLFANGEAGSAPFYEKGRDPFIAESESTVVNTMKRPASAALEIQSLLPFRIKLSPSAFAVVLRAKASDPELASLSA